MPKHPNKRLTPKATRKVRQGNRLDRSQNGEQQSVKRKGTPTGDAFIRSGRSTKTDMKKDN